MSKAVTRGQALEVSARVGTQVQWDEIDGDCLQQKVINLTPEEFGRRFTIFFKNGARVHIIGDLKVTPQPFNPVAFVGKNWSLIPEEHDTRCDALTEVDFSMVEFATCLKENEPSITGEEKLKRMKADKKVRLGATVFAGLWADYQEYKEQSVLERLFQTKGITYLDFFGDILLRPGGSRSVLCLCRDGDGEWDWDYCWLGYDWFADRRSASLAS